MNVSVCVFFGSLVQPHASLCAYVFWFVYTHLASCAGVCVSFFWVAFTRLASPMCVCVFVCVCCVNWFGLMRVFACACVCVFFGLCSLVRPHACVVCDSYHHISLDCCRPRGPRPRRVITHALIVNLGAVIVFPVPGIQDLNYTTQETL